MMNTKKILMLSLLMGNLVAAEMRAYQEDSGKIKEITLEALQKCKRVIHRKTKGNIHEIFQKKKMKKLSKGHMRQSLTGRVTHSRSATITALKGNKGSCSYGPSTGEESLSKD